MAPQFRDSRPSQKAMVGLGRLELPTSRLSGVRSNRAELQAHESLSASCANVSRKPEGLGEMSLRRKRSEDGGVPTVGVRFSESEPFVQSEPEARTQRVVA
jgi:hypothetical protein